MELTITGIKIFENDELVIKGMGIVDGEIILKRRTEDENDVLIMETSQIGESFQASINLNESAEWFVTPELGDVIYRTATGESSYLSLQHMKEFERSPHSLSRISTELLLYKNLKENLSFKISYPSLHIDRLVVEKDRVVVEATDLFKKEDRIVLLATAFENSTKKYEVTKELVAKENSSKIADFTLDHFFDHFIVSPQNTYTVKLELAILDNKKKTVKKIAINSKAIELSEDVEKKIKVINSGALEYTLPEVKIGTISVSSEDEKTQLMSLYLNSFGTESSFKGIFLKKRVGRKDSTDKSSLLEIECQKRVENNVDFIDAKLDYEKCFASVNQNVESIYDAYILIEWSGEKLYYPLSIDQIYKEYLIDSYDIDGKIRTRSYLTTSQTLAIQLTKLAAIKEEGKRVIKLAVIGSCHSRLSFASGRYYNRTYKEKYEIVETIFHSSVASIMSAPVKCDDVIVDAVESDTIRERMFSEFKKDQLEKVKNSSPDFIIIDIYADIFFNLLKVSENQYITENYQFKKNNMERAIIEDYTLVSNENVSELEKIFLNYLDGYIDALRDIIPEERIILQKVRMATSQVKKGKLIPYDKSTLDNIRQQNNNYERFENYIIERMPKLQVLDLDHSKYKSDLDFPYGVSPSHYESKFYRDIMGGVDDIVLSYLISNDLVSDV